MPYLVVRPGVEPGSVCLKGSRISALPTTQVPLRGFEPPKHSFSTSDVCQLHHRGKSGWQDLNLRHSAPKADALNQAALHPVYALGGTRTHNLKTDFKAAASANCATRANFGTPGQI